MRTIYNLLLKQRGKEELLATGSSVQTPDSQFRPFQVYIGVLWMVKTHESGRPANSSQHYNSASWNVRSWPPFANDKDSLEDTNTKGNIYKIMQGTGITLWDNQSYPHTPGQCLKRNHLCCLRLSLHKKLCYIYPDPSQCEINWASSKERRHS